MPKNENGESKRSTGDWLRFPPSRRTRTIGIPWFRPETYHAFRQIARDGHFLAGTYAGWLLGAEAVERRIKDDGRIAVRVYLDPGELALWCQSRDLRVDSRALIRFAAGVAAGKYLKLSESFRGASTSRWYYGDSRLRWRNLISRICTVAK